MFLRPSVLFLVGSVMTILAVGNELSKPVGFFSASTNTVIQNSASGGNTISFRIQNDDTLSSSRVQSDAMISDDLFIISFWFGDDYQHHISFVIDDRSQKAGAYMLNNPMEQYANVRVEHEGCHYTAEDLYDGVLMISYFDSAKRIIAGSFELLAMAPECNNTIRITQGKFDVKLNEDISL